MNVWWTSIPPTDSLHDKPLGGRVICCRATVLVNKQWDEAANIISHKEVIITIGSGTVPNDGENYICGNAIRTDRETDGMGKLTFVAVD